MNVLFKLMGWLVVEGGWRKKKENHKPCKFPKLCGLPFPEVSCVRDDLATLLLCCWKSGKISWTKKTNNAGVNPQAVLL